MEEIMKLKDRVKLIESGLESCKFRGHKMQMTIESVTRKVAFYQCLICRKTMTVIYKPLPNETEISGEAVALNCDPILKSKDNGFYEIQDLKVMF